MRRNTCKTLHEDVKVNDAVHFKDGRCGRVSELRNGYFLVEFVSWTNLRPEDMVFVSKVEAGGYSPEAQEEFESDLAEFEASAR